MLKCKGPRVAKTVLEKNEAGGLNTAGCEKLQEATVNKNIAVLALG